jgi:hypothetical protein
VFGNSAFKFKHVDGTLVLPFRMAEGGYHFLGDISLDSDRNIGELIELVRPLFVLACKLLTVILPPQPRYVFCGCCTDKSHGTNVGDAGYSSQILEVTLHFRRLLKTTLVGHEDLGQFWLMETLACVGTVPPTMAEKLDLLRNCLGPDGVHLTDSGRMHLFNNLAKTILGMKAGTVGKPPKIAEAAACSSVSGRTYYWRGFTSDRGSLTRPPPASGRGRGGSRQGANRVVPYSRPGMPRGGGRGGGGGGSGGSRGRGNN